MIIYGGTKTQFVRQLDCEHEWTDTCMDDLYRYRKCRQCHCVDRDTHEEGKDWVNEHLEGFVRKHYELLEELEATRKTRAHAMQISEERRKALWELSTENTTLRKKLGAGNDV